MTKVITAWDALNRTNASRRIKSVEPAMQKIHALIMEAADNEHTSIDIVSIIKNSSIDVGNMIREALRGLGYEIRQTQDITGSCMIRWDRPLRPAR